jgi:hypothetical protein
MMKTMSTHEFGAENSGNSRTPCRADTHALPAAEAETIGIAGLIKRLNGLSDGLNELNIR